MLEVVTSPRGEGEIFVIFKKLIKVQFKGCESFDKTFYHRMKLLSIELEKRKNLLNKILENSRWSFRKKIKKLS